MPTETTSGQRLASVFARWRFHLAVIGAAALLAAGASELLPKRYTSTATVIIDPPATSDVRVSASLNPAYLDSLRTFENFFTSNTLFIEAADRFHLDTAGKDIDALRRQVLKVKQQHETRILEISVTLPSAVTANQMLRFITDHSIAVSREHAIAADLDSMSNLTAERDRAREQLAAARAAWQQASRNDTPDSIQSAMESAITLESDIRSRESEADADVKEWQVRARDGSGEDRVMAETQARAATARRDEFARRREQVTAEITATRQLLAERSSRLTLAAAELDEARKAYESADTRV